MPTYCSCGCGAFVAKTGLFRKACAKRLGTVCDPRGVQKAANAISNPINNAARAAARPALAKSDAELGLAKIVRYSPEYLRTVVAIALRRPEIQLLWASGSRHFTYWFFWTCEVAAGWRATAEQLASAERRESTNMMRQSSNPLLMVSVPAWAGNCRALLHSDIHFSGSPARIIRVAIGLRVDELAEIEREGCRLTRHRTLGFAGNRRDGGTATAPKEGNIHGVSVLVIDDLAALGIVLAQPFAPALCVRRSGPTGQRACCHATAAFHFLRAAAVRGERCLCARRLALPRIARPRQQRRRRLGCWRWWLRWRHGGRRPAAAAVGAPRRWRRR